jgi:hypothetical protein
MSGSLDYRNRTRGRSWLTHPIVTRRTELLLSFDATTTELTARCRKVRRVGVANPRLMAHLRCHNSPRYIL